MAERAVVLGSGYAGVTAVQRLESADEDIDIVWISDQPYHFVLHCAHKIISKPERRKRLTIPNTDIADDDTRFVEARVMDIETDPRRVVLNDGRKIAYDHLVVGIGSRTATYGIPGIVDHSIPLKSRHDAMQITMQLREVTVDASYSDPGTIVIGGAGLSGIQTAGEIAKFRDKHGAALDIHLVEALDEVFPNAPSSLQRRIRSTLNDHGVHVHTNSPVKHVEQGAVVTDDRTFDSDLFVWTGGITGPEELSDSAIPTDDHSRVVVDETLETNIEGVYAVGDAAIVEAAETEPTAQAARQAGKIAGANIARSIAGEEAVEWEYIDRGTMISVGDEVIAHVPYSPLSTFSGHPAKMLKRGITEAWVESLTGPVSFFDLLPNAVKREGSLPSL